MVWGSVTLRDGTRMPQLAIGSASSAHTGDELADDLVYAMQTVGYTHLDTAQAYTTEQAMGKALKAVKRDSVYVTTKWSGKAPLQQSIKDSLSALDIDYLDLYLIHETRICKGDIVGCWKQMLDFKRNGLAKNVGVSNFMAHHLQELADARVEMPAVNQIFITPYNWKERSEIVALCKKHSIALEAYTSLFSLTKYKGGPLDPVVDEIAEKHKVPAERVLLAWSKSKGITPVVASRSRDRIRSYFDAGDVKLSDDDIAKIEAAGAKGDEASRKNPWGNIENR